MDENTRGQAHSGHNSTGRHEESAGSKKLKKKSLKKFSLSLLAVIVVALLSFVGLYIYQSSTASTIDGGKYQAVFLTNGQVYFGKLKSFNGDYMKLTDIFYLQTKDKTASENPQETSDQANVELIKLGSEIHGPDDEMVVSKDQILFFENLKKDSKVSSTILNYNKTNKK